MNLDELKASTLAALTITEAAELLRVDPRTLRRACEAGEFPSVRVGRRWIIPREKLVALLAGHASETSPPE